MTHPPTRILRKSLKFILLIAAKEGAIILLQPTCCKYCESFLWKQPISRMQV